MSLEEITKSGGSSRIVTGRFKESTEENAGDSGKENTEKRTEEKTLERFEKKRREGATVSVPPAKPVLKG